jgi:hypothetical protein
MYNPHNPPTQPTTLPCRAGRHRYLDFLPSSYPSHPLYYGDAELAELSGLLIEPFVRDRIDQVNASFAAVDAVVRANENHYRPGILTEERFKWAVVTLRSRAHLISIKDKTGEWQKAMCLVPAADMVNMAVRPSDANIACSTDASAGLALSAQRLQCTATRDIAAGEELLTV